MSQSVRAISNIFKGLKGMWLPRSGFCSWENRHLEARLIY